MVLNLVVQFKGLRSPFRTIKITKNYGKSMFQSLLSPREPASAFATTIMYGFGSGKDASTILHHERLIMK